MKQSIQFVRDEHEMEQNLRKAKHILCAHCGATGTLNRHDFRYGNDPDKPDKQTKRGQRLYCSNRGNRGGCGRTMCLVFVLILPGHTITANSLDRLLSNLCKGMSIQAAWEKGRINVALQSVYQILKRLRLRIGAIRSHLLKICRSPDSSQRDPLTGTYEHLRDAFPDHRNPTAAFQGHFQTPVMG